MIPVSSACFPWAVWLVGAGVHSERPFRTRVSAVNEPLHAKVVYIREDYIHILNMLCVQIRNCTCPGASNVSAECEGMGGTQTHRFLPFNPFIIKILNHATQAPCIEIYFAIVMPQCFPILLS